MEAVMECIASLPFLLRLAVGVVLWVLSCILAINLAFGADSLFMYKQLGYAVGDKAAVVLFHLGWLLWPIGLLVVYVLLAVHDMDKERWKELLKTYKRALLWALCYLLGALSLVFLWASV